MNVIIAANFLRSPKKLAFDQPKVAATAIGGIALVLGLAFSAGFLARGADGAAKAEIARWPLVGWLASRGGTIYHHRGSNDSLHGVMHQMVQRLEQGLSVGVFPEGRTTRGDAIATFHARIFQPAVLAGVPAQPVALKYGLRGNAQTIIAFGERENFFQNFVRLLGEPGRVAEVHFLEPVAASEDGRRRMADTCRARIIAAMAG